MLLDPLVSHLAVGTVHSAISLHLCWLLRRYGGAITSKQQDPSISTTAFLNPGPFLVPWLRLCFDTTALPFAACLLLLLLFTTQSRSDDKTQKLSFLKVVGAIKKSLVQKHLLQELDVTVATSVDTVDPGCSNCTIM